MGYKRKVYHLTAEGSDDLHIYVHGVSIKRALRLMQLAATVGDAKPEAESEKDIRELFGAFVDRVVSWTLEEDDDTPVPVELEPFLDWDFDDAMTWVMQWMQKATSVAAPLASTSPTGSVPTGPNPVEASIPMASVSGT
jgi:hypothetical protein